MKRARPSEISVHPSPEELMSFLDGELDQTETCSLERHLRSCRACRDALGRFAEAAAEFSWDVIAPASPAPAEAATPRFRPMAVSGVLSNRSVAASIAVLLVGALVAHLALSPPPVSARGLVEVARKKEDALRHEHPNRAVVRRLRVTKTTDGGAWSVERWAATRAPEGAPEQLAVESGTATEIAAELPKASCRTFVPLSIEMLDCLLDAKGLSVAVQEDNDDGAATYEIDLSSFRSQLTAFHASWTLDKRDWRLRSVVYRFGATTGNATYRIDEEAFELIPTEPAAPESLALPRTGEISEAVEPRELPAARSGDTQAANRLLAYEALSAWGPTPEDDVRIVDGADRSVRVDGIVEGDLRRAALRERLADYPGVEVAVSTRAEAMEALLGENTALPLSEAPDERQPSTAMAEPEVRVAAVRSEGPLVAEILESRFGGDDGGKTLALEFGEAVLEETQQLAFEARWLERLDEAFSSEETEGMSAGAGERLRALRAGWRQRVRDRHDALRAKAMAVLCPNGCAEVMGSGEGDATQAEVVAGRNGWMETLSRELALLKSMFVDAGFTPAGTIPEAIGKWWNASGAVSRALEAEIRFPEGVAVSAESGRTPRH